MITGKQKGMIAALFAMLLFTSMTHAAVDITSFRAVWEGDDIRVTWQTGSQIDHAFFNLWRSEENLPIVDGQIDLERANRVNTSAIIGANPCTANGDAYTLLDRGVPLDAETMYYYLESAN